MRCLSLQRHTVGICLPEISCIGDLMIYLLRGALKGEPIGQGSWYKMVLAWRARAAGKRCKQA